jgi:hypothetical protein
VVWTRRRVVSYDSYAFSFMWDVKVMFIYHSLRTGGPGIETRWEGDLPHQSRPAPGSTKPPVLPGPFLGVKRPRRGVDHPSPSSTEVKESVDMYLYSPSGLSWPVLGWPLPSRVSVTTRWRSAGLLVSLLRSVWRDGRLCSVDRCSTLPWDGVHVF